VAAVLPAEPWAYRRSSLAYYALGRADPPVQENPCYHELGAKPARLQQQWRQFLLGEDAREGEIGRAEFALGDEAFPRGRAGVRGRPTGRRRGRPVAE